jgi:hypothetical protein
VVGDTVNVAARLELCRDHGCEVIVSADVGSRARRRRAADGAVDAVRGCAGATAGARVSHRRRGAYAPIKTRKFRLTGGAGSVCPKMRRLLAVLTVLALVLPAYAGTKLRKPPKSRGFQTRVGEYSIGAGQDVEVCEFRRLANTKPVDVARFKLRMPPGAHHFALWTYGGSLTDDEFPAGPVESIGCTGFARDEFIPQLMIPTTSPNTSLKFPKGVALRIEPNHPVFLNPHMRNSGGETVVPDVRFNFYAAKKGTVKHYAEGFTFGNSTNIKIPAGGDQTLTSEWVVPINITIVYMTTHQHRLGTYAKVELVEADDVTRTLLVESYGWEHPRAWPQGAAPREGTEAPPDVRVAQHRRARGQVRPRDHRRGCATRSGSSIATRATRRPSSARAACRPSRGCSVRVWRRRRTDVVERTA